MLRSSPPVKPIALVACAIALSGCIGISPEARHLLQQPSSCDQAAEAQMLKDQRSGGWFRLTQGVQGVAPPMVVLSLLRDIVGKPFRSIYLDHWRVALGSYNRQIDERVAEFEQCGGAAVPTTEPESMGTPDPMRESRLRPGEQAREGR